ncbi:MAG: small subunit ribosomal protein [Acidimicrobiaceae bacterium]|jgi:small subunit ribosomal protein S18
MAKKAPRTKNKDNARRSKKKTSVLVQESVDYIDYKDVNLLRRFMSDRAKIRARRVTGNDAQQQREVARAIKNAREMALLPYTNRVTTQRTSRERPDRGDRPDRPGSADGPPPRPQGPPPSATAAEDAPTDAALVDVPDVPDADVFVGAGDDEEG